jgi:hypothetical protein
LPWKFLKTPKNYWGDDNNKKKYLYWLGKQLGIKELNDWYKVTPKDIKEHGGQTLVYVYSSLPNLLSIAYPDHNWEKYKFSSAYNWDEMLQGCENQYS